jgi:multiple antibiotic resistance protein
MRDAFTAESGIIQVKRGNMLDFIRSTTLLFMLLNPFLMVVYMIDVFDKLPASTFRSVVIRAGIISSIVFSLAAVLGDVLFRDLLQAEFASFQVFGGVVFLLIGLRFVFEGNAAIKGLRGESRHIAGSIAMPLMIGPGTIGASIVVGKRLSQVNAVLSIMFAVLASVSLMIILKYIHDYVRVRNEELVQRYIDIAGRVTALVVGTFAIEMIMRGLAAWKETIGQM